MPDSYVRHRDDTARVPLRAVVAQHFDWTGWEALIERNGYTLDRPVGTPHPDYPRIIYPIDYGYIDGTIGTDRQEVDLFVGHAENGLVGTLLTTDHRKGDREFKLLYNCAPPEVYMVYGFINFDRSHLEGALVLRHTMYALWQDAPSLPAAIHEDPIGNG